MSHKPGIGKNVYSEALVRGRNATKAASQALARILDEQPGPHTTALLIAKAALSLRELEAVLSELDEIGRYAKNLERSETKRNSPAA